MQNSDLHVVHIGQERDIKPYIQEIDDVIFALNSNLDGLTSNEATRKSRREIKTK